MSSNPVESRQRFSSVRTPKRGSQLLHDPLLNKGTAFPEEEREAFGLVGLLPEFVSTLDLQVQRVYESICRKTEPLERYIGLASLQDRNETLFYRLLIEHVEEFLPIVYTPTVGLATQLYSHIFRRSRGLWITPAHRGRIAEVLRNHTSRDVRLIVVTDAERILGLGDQGAGGIAIPIGKLSLYTLGSGIHPSQTLPICLDVGTDNQELLGDELYIGRRQPRLRGEEYDALVEEFVQAVQEVFPQVLLQWEDFKKANAMRLLERYRKRLLSFNDDIQGTAAVALAGVLAGVRATEVPLAEHRTVILGAGAAGTGIAGLLASALEREGLSRDEILRRVAILDSRGLLVEGREYRGTDDYKARWSWPAELAGEHGLTPGEGIELPRVAQAFRPTILIGTSGQPGAFGEEVIRTMAASATRPLVFPFSNPTSKSEAVPADVIAWTDGRALVATGSPFDPVEYEGQTYRIGQGNNVYIFPGVGLGALAAGAREVTDTMFTAAADTLAASVSDEELAEGLLYPRLPRLREVTRRLAGNVAREAMRAGVAPACDDATLEARLDEWIWNPVYPRIEAI